MRAKRANAVVALLMIAALLIHLAYEVWSYMTFYYNPLVTKLIADLVVDRSRIEESLKEADAYIRDYKPSAKTGKAAQKEYKLQYQTAKCLKCGLCLEVCPNYKSGERFFGALFANDCYLIDSQSGDAAPEIKDVFDEHFAAGCSKSLSCMDVCPMKIDTIASIARMSRK